MALSAFDFEQPVIDLENELKALQELNPPPDNLAEQVSALRERIERTRREIYDNLSAWQILQIARHQARPRALDYVRRIFTDWTELHGDRAYGDDHACIAGFALLDEQPVCLIGQQKGLDVRDNAYRNYGMMHPEGYRKALRVMRLAEKFGRPVICLLDTAGAFPGVGAEERGQAEAIARNILEMSTLRTPVICIVIGEGGSGGALGIGVGNRVLMQQYAFYSLISPEGCASILWRDAKFAPEAARALKFTARDLKELGVIDEIIPEPEGGAHRDANMAARLVGQAIRGHLAQLRAMSIDEIVEDRFQKFRRIGQWEEIETAP
ncbi:MAG TPA: acetyl-CoA carboxylase carboxyltransferase subunit alpha [Candidatus Sumerlaeota bacterium]|nr:MAG: Acetyl-coenzyme A carboxylase carboxyl transferase subunit alpha [candidate division BRC1 bacterium ADurb.BinA292]HOE96165.1 acetyl-CoA carboxylase carboxyltransferase subunit alpha [Candidatus Sumerlaeota bacterium]HOR28036.1 acetyl-CoA carboxylase carboxyltransferase subunit alpha [Candidatus Sumerlaeota bacterium]